MAADLVSHPGFFRANRIAKLSVSEIIKISTRARELRAEGHPVIILGAGEPDFDTPDHVKQAGIAAIEAGQTKYTPLDGTPELKKAICDKLARENGLNYQPANISVSAGAKQVLFNAFMATINPGDEVIIPTPFWTTYADIVEVCGGVPVLVQCPGEKGFRLQPDQLEAAITPKTKWLMLNSPSNPSGAAYSADELMPLLNVLKRNPHVWLVSDDIYEHITYDDFKFVTPAQLAPELQSRILLVNGVSKSHAMTGWRIGFGAGPVELIKAMAVMQSQSTSCASSVSQAAAIEALNGDNSFLEERRLSFQERRDLVVAGLNDIQGVTCRVPEGAFYTFASCEGLIGKKTPSGKTIESDSDFCRYILEESHVAIVPGSAFGLSPYFRISYAAAKTELVEAISRIQKAASALA
ncbi:pyridoxal phosphate-dependent aminotransferase [Maritalea sp. S77]|uniref:pyridoxal phosphate-dependent aminotransferase n=1 Tax=Maritalea sp. S77 TaxID=3415125 RepID=UPI003C7B5BBD